MHLQINCANKTSQLLMFSAGLVRYPCGYYRYYALALKGWVCDIDLSRCASGR